eukprot:GHVT01026203.1.p1 GENE.GHVT01026203.1~~GHVT01026203.1.p1  ORF type:complete len:324 (+),score=95.35 GHVT01026203.1:1562-2533(+)
MRGLCECPALTSVDLSHNGFDVCADESSLSPAGRGASTLGAGPPRGPNELDTLTADEKAVEPTGAKRLDDRRELDGKQDSQSTQTRRGCQLSQAAPGLQDLQPISGPALNLGAEQRPPGEKPHSDGTPKRQRPERWLQKLIELLQLLPQLQCVYLHGNPAIRNAKFYRKHLVAGCPGLRFLDERPVRAAEKALAAAWAAGGAERERAELQRLKWKEQEAQRTSLDDFRALQARHRENMRLAMARLSRDSSRLPSSSSASLSSSSSDVFGSDGATTRPPSPSSARGCDSPPVSFRGPDDAKEGEPTAQGQPGTGDPLPEAEQHQ